MKKAAMMGGTFNPIHYGHLRTALEVKEALGLEKVLFVPANVPPHKGNADLAPAEERLEIVRLAVEGNRDFEVSDMEIKRGGKSYTIDTVREFNTIGIDVTLIVGADQFNDISTWCSYEELLDMADFAVVSRFGFAAKKIAEVMPIELARKFWYDEKGKAYVNGSGRKIRYVATTLLDISSSGIRRRFKEGFSVRYLMPDIVERYIRGKGLY
ncbi:MAG: nicotinate-nucleotide adenylyltransferase [Thermodesulfobacteriota bacterium]